jgi:ABC-type transport system involved in cytochrome bd biosynthesis fused ATPase/permease subunit
MADYQANVRIDERESATFNSIEQSRTMVLQESRMDYRSTIFSMITDIDEDQAKERRHCELESLVWHFLSLVCIDDFVRQELNSDLDERIENKLSGGQKTRLLLARALFRTHQRHSSLLILDEPDKGLPAETTIAIIDNIIRWYRSKGILFITLHTEQLDALSFDQVLNIQNGIITKVK